MTPLADYIRSYTERIAYVCVCVLPETGEKHLLCYQNYLTKNSFTDIYAIKQNLFYLLIDDIEDITNKTTTYYFSYQHFMTQIKHIHDTNYNFIFISYMPFDDDLLIPYYSDI